MEEAWKKRGVEAWKGRGRRMALVPGTSNYGTAQVDRLIGWFRFTKMSPHSSNVLRSTTP